MGDDVLKGWTAISQYLKVDPKTAMRYRKLKGLPVKYNNAGHAVITKQTVDQWRFGAMSEHCLDDDR
jgi:hypothetical protein